MQCLFFYVSGKAKHQQTNAAAEQKESHSSTDEDHTGIKTPTSEDSKNLNSQLYSDSNMSYMEIPHISSTVFIIA